MSTHSVLPLSAKPRDDEEIGRPLKETGCAAAVLFSLAAGYLFNRWMSVSYGLPRDGVKAWNGADMAVAVWHLIDVAHPHGALRVAFEPSGRNPVRCRLCGHGSGVRHLLPGANSLT